MPMPTLQQIIGTITGKVAFERTQANFTTIKDAHNSLETTVNSKANSSTVTTLQQEVTSHKAEIVTHQQSVQRDVAVMGVQVITLPFKAKHIKIISTKASTADSWSIGSWDVNNNHQRVIYNYNMATGVIILGDGVNSVTGVIQNVTETGFEIYWTKVGSGLTGTLYFIVFAQTHGGV